MSINDILFFKNVLYCNYKVGENMFEMKYPDSDNLNDKFHKIQVIEAYEIEIGNKKEILVYGLDEGKTVRVVLVYNEDIHSYVYVPHTDMEFASLTSPYLERKDITNELIKRIDGKRVLNVEEVEINKTVDLNQELINKREINSFEKENYDVKIKTNDKIDKESTDLENDQKKSFDNTFNEGREIDALELFEVNYKKAVNLIGDFLKKNLNNYAKAKQLEIIKLVKELVNNINDLAPIFFTEDDLIDLGNLFAKLNYDRVNNYTQEEYNDIIKKGYELIERLKTRPKRK